MKKFRSLEICAGGGGQALGLEQAGFEHAALVEIDPYACQTLRLNRPAWNVIEGDLTEFSAKDFYGIDLLAGGVPCPPFSVAGKQLGSDDERDMFPQALRLVRECHPNAILLENVRGLLNPSFDTYRKSISDELIELGYIPEWKLLNSSHYGVSQLRPRLILIAIKNTFIEHFTWPIQHHSPLPTVGELLIDLMAEGGWEGATEWMQLANGISPTIVGGSKKHGGPDLGPSRARKAWAMLGVDGGSIANHAPQPGFIGMPKLTLRMVARLQGFPDSWKFHGVKTHAYRQVGNAFPPPVAKALGKQIYSCLSQEIPEKQLESLRLNIPQSGLFAGIHP